MLKRFGMMGLLLSASAVVLPTAASARDNVRREGGYSYAVDNRDVRERGPKPAEGRRDDRDRDRVRTYYYAPAPNYYYAPAPYCNR